jgi:hypothetical protein
MTQVPMDKDLALDLISTKLREIKSNIEAILKKWGQNSIKTMIQLSREGTLPESEMDVISLTNLHEKMVELEKFSQDLENNPEEITVVKTNKIKKFVEIKNRKKPKIRLYQDEWEE